MDDTKTTQVTGEQRTRSGAASLFSAAHGYAPCASNRESEGVGGVRPYYCAGGVTIFHGNAVDLLPEILPALASPMVFSDPPYGVTDHEWDIVVPTRLWMLTAGAVVTATEPYATALINEAPLPFAFDCVWVKNCVSNAMNAKRMPMRRHERVLVFGEYEWNPQRRRRTALEMSRLNREQREKYEWLNPDTVLEYESVNCRHSERTEHPSQKPVPLMEYLIRSFSSGSVVDPFCGSGSTLVGAKRAGRVVVGIDREERFCALAAQRCAQEMPLGGGGGFSSENPSTAEKGHNDKLSD